MGCWFFSPFSGVCSMMGLIRDSSNLAGTWPNKKNNHSQISEAALSILLLKHDGSNMLSLNSCWNLTIAEHPSEARFSKVAKSPLFSVGIGSEIRINLLCIPWCQPVLDGIESNPKPRKTFQIFSQNTTFLKIKNVPLCPYVCWSPDLLVEFDLTQD